ncbi:zinc finger protein 486 [Folsomia candida]|uniref:Zinc finger protein 91 n=1 Tax=Folsomia candida TaxID=158441 RepID=A0A226DK41_FOLCA|nr:zinc finger protein 486 [Folsomia candida]XP_035713579.1 zinc finger protein 486 [Folsomia candida]XP_035713580.1 zinc finger protein 486 [Folsomia candida]XP_035713581.1 zinc finger protein 486 [Folsomia candida]XP_035713582.1 zinc finger protein 486 [Folsomia candida]OXA44971.1 Zinc finger protein 91 [Folsomia candida]
MEPTPENKWECAKCSKQFKTKDNLTRHMVTHDPDAKVKCEVCGNIFKNKRSLSTHKFEIHIDQTWCATCDQMFSSVDDLRRHNDTVHGGEEPPRFSCPVPRCKKTYQHEEDVAKHVETEHVRFRCTLCRRTFETRVQLEAHISSHTRYKCATCLKSFARIRDMKLHEATHLEKSARDVLQCPLCPETFLTRRGLQGHVRVVHENQRNYPCTFCDKRFSQTSNLKRHVEAVHATYV